MIHLKSSTLCTDKLKELWKDIYSHSSNGIYLIIFTCTSRLSKLTQPPNDYRLRWVSAQCREFLNILHLTLLSLLVDCYGSLFT